MKQLEIELVQGEDFSVEISLVAKRAVQGVRVVEKVTGGVLSLGGGAKVVFLVFFLSFKFSSNKKRPI